MSLQTYTTQHLRTNTNLLVDVLHIVLPVRMALTNTKVLSDLNKHFGNFTAVGVHLTEPLSNL